MQRIGVLVVDPSPAVVDGLESILRAHDVQMVGTASSAEEAIDRARELRPDVVLMDLEMTHIGGLEATLSGHYQAIIASGWAGPIRGYQACGGW